MPVTPYSPDVEQRMTQLYRLLNEKDRRWYAAIEAAKLGYGGQTYISRLFRCDGKTIRRGLKELNAPPDLPRSRIRRKRRRSPVAEHASVTLRSRGSDISTTVPAGPERRLASQLASAGG
jgi:hypothetical protein